MCNGLQAAVTRVLIVLPQVTTAERHEVGVLRLPPILSLGARQEFRLANIFQPGIYRSISGLAVQTLFTCIIQYGSVRWVCLWQTPGVPVDLHLSHAP